MGLLIKKTGNWLGTGSWRWVQVLTGVWLMAAVLVTCSAPVPMVAAGPHFSHALHVGQFNLECTLCHNSVMVAENAGMPGIRLCKPCHDSFDAKKPADRRIAAFFDQEGQFKAQHIARQDDEIVFSHLAHLGKYGLSCEDCHGSAGTGEVIPLDSKLTMEECIVCHTESGKRNTCEDCHSVLGRATEPRTHDKDWLRAHGPRYLLCDGMPDKGGWVNRCEICHSKTDCQSCHKEQMPRNHTNFWRLKGHSLMTSIDRSRCWTCHRSDFCDRCHEGTPPRNHTATWGSPLNRHCNNCHGPGQGQTCATCHKATPSHNLAAPMPPGHHPAMNCRQCHGNGQPLPHPDPGITCTSCHK